MLLEKGKKIFLVGAAVLPLVVVGALFFAANNNIRPSKASAYTMSLNNNNSPTLNAGEGTMLDEKGVTWEYRNASDLANGHVTIGHQGYFGVSSSSQYGYTAISELTVNFTAGTDGELWLLTSIDGVDWNEQIMLESGVATDWANDWRYIRFYCWDDNNTPINVSSVSFDYECTGISSSDDMDSACVDKVLGSSNLTITAETSVVSPRGNSTQALKLVRTANSSYVELALHDTRQIYNYHTKVIEFDYYHKNNQNKPSIQFFNGSKSIGTSVGFVSSKSNYKVSDINSDWWHIEIHVTSIVARNVDHDDKNTPNDPADRIRVTTGNCVIDNFRLSCRPSDTNNPLGIYNNGTSFTHGGYYWMKVSWAGTLHSCAFSFDVPGIAEQDMNANMPFYLHGLQAGTVVVTATVVSGYNRSVATISNTITVN